MDDFSLSLDAIVAICNSVLKAADAAAMAYGDVRGSAFSALSEAFSFALLLISSMKAVLCKGAYELFLRYFLEQLVVLAFQNLALDIDGNEYYYGASAKDIGSKEAFKNSQKMVLFLHCLKLNKPYFD